MLETPQTRQRSVPKMADRGASGLLREEAEGGVQETKLRRDTDNTAGEELEHREGCCVVAGVAGRVRIKPGSVGKMPAHCLAQSSCSINSEPYSRHLSHGPLGAQRSKASLPLSRCHASSHPYHLLQPNFLINEKHTKFFSSSGGKNCSLCWEPSVPSSWQSPLHLILPVSG